MCCRCFSCFRDFCRMIIRCKRSSQERDNVSNSQFSSRYASECSIHTILKMEGAVKEDRDREKSVRFEEDVPNAQK